MYYIYHIDGVKIGCSTNAERRVKSQGYSNFEILETHTDINLAAKREIELQKEYGYVESNIHTNYVQQYNFAIKGVKASRGLGAKAQIEKGIGIFGYSKEERQKLNASIAHLGGKASAEINSRPVNAYDYKTNTFIGYFKSIAEAALKFNASNGNIHSVINGSRNHTKGYTFKYA
jgi:hypothetical protein